ncbi:MAG: hypothetical protein JEZ00_07695 [Anaerolineaceae bacterium]|nr:hypothetical protein [Anaerolineaceae bacterium]
MSYPKSSDVVAGQPTAADHYNFLRADALRLGADEGDAIPLGQLLCRYEDNLSLEVISDNRIRVPASASMPVCLMIDGVPLMTTLAVDLPTAQAPSGENATYYVFAVRSTGSTSFTVEINTSSGASAGKRLVGCFEWDGSIRNLQTIKQQTQLIWIQQQMAPLQQARLTLESGVAVPTEDRSGSMLYLTPYKGNRVSLYVQGAGWQLYVLEECGLSFSGVAAGTNADVFLRHNGTALVLERILWTDDDSRAEELSLVDGIWLRSADLTWRYVGTVRTSAEGILMDSETQRFVWNADQRVPRTVEKVLASGSYTYSGSSRLWRGESASKVELVCGLSGEAASLTCATTASTTGVLKIGMGINTMTFTTAIRSQLADISPMVCTYYGLLAAGYVVVNLLEACSPGEANIMPENVLGIGSVNGIFNC